MVEINYKTYCFWGAIQNPSLHRSFYPNGQARYWFQEGGQNYKTLPEMRMKTEPTP